MSQQPSTSLLWINKNATNVHSRKHVPEANAHVQKTSSKKRTRKTTASQTRTLVPALKLKRKEPPLPTIGRLFDVSDPDCENRDTITSRPVRTGVLVDGAEPGRIDNIHNIASSTTRSEALFCSVYLEDDVASSIEPNRAQGKDQKFDTKFADSFTRSDSFIPVTLGATDPIPGFLAGMSNHDKMLLHTHLTYLPQLYMGLSANAHYCPFRNASVDNMLQAPIATMWVLISLDMFLETARRSNARTAIILRRKSRAYQVMANALHDQSHSDDDSMLLGPVAAAIAEMTCGDPSKAVTHTNGIDSYIQAKGGLDHIKQMELRLSLPIFTVSAYRTLIQDNLLTAEDFQNARDRFCNSLLSLRSWNQNLMERVSTGLHLAESTSPHDEGFDGEFDLNQGVQEFQEDRTRAFLYHPILRKFLTLDYDCKKPGERIDHFVVPYNLCRSLADYGPDFKKAIHFIEDLIDDIEAAGSSKDADSSIRISGVSRALMYRQAQMYPNDPGAGVALGWGALDALEVMKLLPRNMQQSIYTSLYHWLTGHSCYQSLSVEDIDTLQMVMTAEWRARHVSRQYSNKIAVR